VRDRSGCVGTAATEFQVRRDAHVAAWERCRTAASNQGTEGSNPVPSTGESKANPISWIMADADAKKLAGATPITGFGRLLRKH
jgi:hypothetical protein